MNTGDNWDLTNKHADNMAYSMRDIMEYIIIIITIIIIIIIIIYIYM